MIQQDNRSKKHIYNAKNNGMAGKSRKIVSFDL